MNDTSHLVLYLLTAPKLRFRALLTEKGAESRVVENIQSEGSLFTSEPSTRLKVYLLAGFG